MSIERPSLREFAAVTYALGVLRGHLSSVLEREANLVELTAALRGTSAANIARAIGLTEGALGVDWNEHLSEHEKRIIQGADA